MDKKIGLLNNDPKKYAKNADIKELENILRYLSDAYYNTSKPLVSDEIFDLLKEALQERDPTNKFLKEIGAQMVCIQPLYDL